MDELDRLKRLADEQKSQKLKVEGRIESLTDDLKNEGFETVGEARKAMRSLNDKISRMEKALERKTEEFKEKYADKLSEET